jgi:hypothetical protein
MSEEKDDVPQHSHPSVDIRTITAPILTLLSIAGMIVWATTSVWQQKEALKNEIRLEMKELSHEWKEHLESVEGTTRQYRELIHQMEDALTIMKYRQKFMLENMWTKRDHAIWCRELERTNKNFVCPDEDLRRSGLIGSDKYIGPVDRDRENMLEDLKRDNGKLFNKVQPYHNPDYYDKEKK